jgi:hypothetical protein
MGSPVPDGADASCARKAKKGLFAKAGEHVVEIVLDSVPDADGEVFVRTGRTAAPRRVSAASLALLGFLPASET